MVGTISASLYWHYFTSGLHGVLLMFLLLLFLIAQGNEAFLCISSHGAGIRNTLKIVPVLGIVAVLLLKLEFSLSGKYYIFLSLSVLD